MVGTSLRVGIIYINFEMCKSGRYFIESRYDLQPLGSLLVATP